MEKVIAGDRRSETISVNNASINLRIQASSRHDRRRPHGPLHLVANFRDSLSRYQYQLYRRGLHALGASVERYTCLGWSTRAWVACQMFLCRLFRPFLAKVDKPHRWQNLWKKTWPYRCQNVPPIAAVMGNYSWMPCAPSCRRCMCITHMTTSEALGLKPLASDRPWALMESSIQVGHAPNT
ncbi:hypothetical protein FIBSPDRAFT_381508 [Athelia psychrophila]|uniref:Uncharacterized protein n=1 Tax=Athelia psychrophila TaxID=1759441 RepID=A0A167VB75_9AGAM|nr:hypothetical protein FIBSPDRAFT_432778 [Fibularhizoctonia sp. CBS 109695]KZP04824.1 hypothetical protein FIBSPDRAFT_381508 [Fibularhizoctonia sp. CBS 109695]